MTDIYRTHDLEIYLNEDRYEEPKEIFKVVRNLVDQNGGISKGSTVCDIGCATGEFLYYLSREFPEANYRGYDIMPDLLDQAREKVHGVEFHVGSVLDESLIPSSSIDIAFLLGVHYIFDDFEPTFANLISWTRPGGRIYIVGLFNPHPIDVWIKYRQVGDPDPNHREPGWNMFSKASVSNYLDTVVRPGNHSYTAFEMPFDLPPNPTDPARTWTFVDDDGRRLLTNGLSLLCNMEILEIRL